MKITNLDNTVVEKIADFLSFFKEHIDPSHPAKETVSLIKKYINEDEVLPHFSRELNDLIKNHKRDGYFLYDFNTLSESSEDIRLINLLLICCVGNPIWLFKDKSLWFELTVKTDIDKGRTHGVGENKLHMDMVGFSEIPAIISFHSIRKDPQGGGRTFLSDINEAVKALNSQEIELLSRPIFKYWHDEGVCEVGYGLDAFPLIDKDHFNTPIYRFTAKMENHFNTKGIVLTEEAEIIKDDVVLAFRKLCEKIEEIKQRTILQPGQILIFNQLRFCHGRGQLGANQENVSLGKRRLISQCYAH